MVRLQRFTTTTITPTNHIVHEIQLLVQCFYLHYTRAQSNSSQQIINNFKKSLIIYYSKNEDFIIKLNKNVVDNRTTNTTKKWPYHIGKHRWNIDYDYFHYKLLFSSFLLTNFEHTKKAKEKLYEIIYYLFILCRAHIWIETFNY
jgi:hypothetical protein